MGNARLIVFCSVQPHDVPPPYLSRVAEGFSRLTPTIFIDLPTADHDIGGRHSVSTAWHMLTFLFRRRGLLLWRPYLHAPGLSSMALGVYLALYKALRRASVILYTTSPKPDRVYRYIPRDASVFDCYDNPDDDLAVYRDSIRTFTAVLANSPAVYDRLHAVTDTCRLSSAGYHDYRAAAHPRGIPHTVVFYGGISHRIAFDWLSEAVRRLPGTHFVFIGESYLNRYYIDGTDPVCQRKWESLLASPTVHFWNTSVPPQSAQAVLGQFCVGIIPYDAADPFNYHSHPIKVYDYLASGIPVVSTAIPAVMQYEGRAPVRIARNAGEFVKLLRTLSAAPYVFTARQRRETAAILRAQQLETKLGQCTRLFTELGV